MDASVSELTKKPFKNWKSLFQVFFRESVVTLAQNNDDGLSCFFMGLYHEDGFVVEKDYQTALEYYRLGANKREPFCLYKLYEIHSGKNHYGVEVDKDTALLYLIWAVLYLLPVYGTHICLDLDLELQLYYKNVLKKDKGYVHDIIEQFEDDIFAHDKEMIRYVFDFVIESIAPSLNFNAQEEYNKMIDGLIAIGEKEDPKFPALFMFKSVLWDFQNVSDRNHRQVMKFIREKKCAKVIYQNIKSIFDYLNIVHEKHAIVSKFLRFDGIEVFWQVKYNADSDDIKDKKEACYYIAKSLYEHLFLMENNVTMFISMDLMAKCYEEGVSTEKDVKKALQIIESSRSFAGFSEDDFPYLRVGRLHEKLGNTAMGAQCYEKYIGYSYSKRDLPIKFFRQGRYYELCKKDLEKAVETLMKGLIAPPEFYTFQLEIYSMKCYNKIWKLIRKDQELYEKFHAQLESLRN